ncbi:hypothetical protein DL764_001031 [Monosporascus ibericus]|uniref:Heterokaryon incompatibility domain-containing protein n=1 Tax=Monosporascus ibericus TaxID=155417 RepID=A0A4Q4TUR4_9PEZI|nr:hypothetical protein DL764_001031 [Monosporascus ibericus]
MATRCEYCAKLTVSRLVELAEEEYVEQTEFPQRAYYQHHSSFSELDRSAGNGCDLCRLIIDCFRGAPVGFVVEDPWEFPLTWPETWVGPERCDIAESMYAAAKQLPVSDVKLALRADHQPNELDTVRMFDTILVKVGPERKPDPEEFDSDFDYHEMTFPCLQLRLRVPRGTLNRETCLWAREWNARLRRNAADKAVRVGKYQIGRFDVDPDLGSPANWSIAKTWLDTCRESHPDCFTAAVAELPTRVIDVGELGSSRGPRLVETQRRSGEEYAALSHCWGGKINTMLTKQTLRRFLASLPYAELPANFRDAITITKRLGLRYLWIDALCILQDSKYDWEIESKRMGPVYRDAAVTISASASTGSTDGILKRVEDTPLPEPVSLRASADEGAQQEVLVTMKDLNEEDLNLLDMSGPLASRGWTFQESVLSLRLLHYGKRQIYWQCRQGYQAADGIPPGLKYPESSLYPVFSTLLSSDRGALPDSFDVNHLLRDYYDMVVAFSYRKFSYDSDKLPALSGLAQRIHKALGGEYLAGLWSADFNRGLLWYREMLTCEHISEYRAPSWSWAVTNERICLKREPLESNDIAAQLVEYDVEPRSPTYPHGEIISGYVVMKGLTKRLIRSNQSCQILGSPLDVGAVDFDEPEKGHSWENNLLLRTENEADDYILSAAHDYGSDPGSEIDLDACSSQDYLALLVGQYDQGEGNGSRQFYGAGLVLRPVAGQGENVYERLGHFSLQTTSEWIETWQSDTLKLI